MLVNILAAFALVLVFEGILPFLNPMGYRRWLIILMTRSNRSLRKMGLISMLLGLGLSYVIHFGG